MKFTDIPTWLYLPLKVILLLGFTVPLFLWGGQLLGLSREAETAMAARGIGEIKQLEKEGAAHLASAEQGPSPAADAGPVLGIDVSHYQGTVRWDKVAKANIKFAFAKATGGDTYVDPHFQQNWHGMRASELYRGAYHFFYAADDPKTQADHYVKTIGELKATDLPPVLDVEIADHTDPETLLKGVLVWLETVEKATGRLPVLYTDNGFADKILTDARLSRYPLWIADYAEEVHTLPSPWKKSGWTMWQYSEKGRVEGVTGEVDMDRFEGSLSGLIAFIDKSHVNRGRVIR